MKARSCKLRILNGLACSLGLLTLPAASLGHRGPVDVQIIPDGTPSMADNPILIACRDNNRVVIVRRTGQVVWAMNAGLTAPRKAERLANGNTLIADTGNNRVIEVNAARQIVTSFTAEQLADGSTLIDAERLADGSTLVLCDNGQLLQYMPSESDPFVLPGDFADLSGATDVDVLEEENGYRLLITTPTGVIETGY